MNFSTAVFENAFGLLSQLPESTLPEICFAGKSNVGKSSLINKTLGRKALARVSGKPGKTVTINFYKLDNARIVDLPGYGYAKVDYREKERWADLMEGYFRGKRNIPMVFQLIDMRHKVGEFDLSMLEFLNYYKIPYMIVLTKCDKLNKTEFAERLSSVREELAGIISDTTEILPVSALSGEGTERLRKIIIESVE
ncbi:MAG: YihA family ribosome biogenesis GTP-binding protein [Clostridia bacterium]|nr:YihA family ribosome biogenesis GTP-binding protein [Clostridia bacterium]